MDAVATAKLALDASGFDRGLATAQSSVMRFAKTTGGLIAGAFALDKIIAGFSSAIEKGDQLQDIAEKFGVSASKLQLLGNAASVFGSGIDQVSAGLNKLSLAQQKALAGDNGLANTFAEVGISLDDLRSMRPEDILLKISDSFASGANKARQFIIVDELLGKAQTDLIKVLNQGSAAIIEQGENIGVYTDEQIASLSALSDSLKKFQNLISLVFGVAAAAIMNAVEAYARFAEIQSLIKFFDQAKPGSSKAGRGATDVTESADFMAAVAEEKKKLDKKLYDEEIYDIQEAARLEANRDKTLFDRMMRDAEFARDEKSRILQLEKDTALKNREAVMRGIESAGPLLDRVRAAAERMGDFRSVRDIDRMRQDEQRRTDVQLLDTVLSPNRFRSEESISALTQVEGESQRMQNMELVKSVLTMQGIVQFISEQIDSRLGVPILRSAN